MTARSEKLILERNTSLILGALECGGEVYRHDATS
jgi:hypothetical protein